MPHVYQSKRCAMGFVMNAFCSCPSGMFLPQRRVATFTVVTTTRRVTLPCAKMSKPSRKKRPQPARSTPGFSSSSSGSHNSESELSNERMGNREAERDDQEAPSREERASGQGRDLTKVDSNGISMEHRLREEILHPLRKPKQTLFATLTFSAVLGLFFACGRLLAEKDGLGRVSINVAVDAGAVALFGYLFLRELEFGRRSLNSIAGRPQPRDLPVVSLASTALQRPRFRLPFRRDKDDTPRVERFASLLRGAADAVIVAGRATDARKYLERCVADAGYASDDAASAYGAMHPVLVVFPTDSRGSAATDLRFPGATAVAGSSVDDVADWVAWLGDAIPPRRNVALFRINARDGTKDAANACIVTVDDPTVVPLPENAKRLVIVDV